METSEGGGEGSVWGDCVGDFGGIWGWFVWMSLRRGAYLGMLGAARGGVCG